MASHINKYATEEDRSLYTNPERVAWTEKVNAIDDLGEALSELVAFRTEHVGVMRKSQDKAFDALWMESQLEGRLGQLKSAKFQGKALLDTCACGTPADGVLKDWKAKIDAAKDNLADLEELAIVYRRGFKPPIMPANHWLEGDSYLSEKLLIIRSNHTSKLSMEELREMRKVRIVA